MSVSLNHSYFYKYDDVYGWGNRSFFTYYNQFGRPVGAKELEIVCMTVVFLVSLVTNVGLAFVIVRFKELHTITNYFILNLALADLLFSASIPIVIIVRLQESWTLGELPCRLLLYLQFVCGAVLLWSLTAISFERYQRIVIAVFRKPISTRWVALTTMGIWLTCLLTCIPVAIYFTVLEFPYESTTIKVCTLIFPNITFRISYLFISVMLFVNCFLPIAWLVFNYVFIFRKLYVNERRWQQNLANRRWSSQYSEEAAKHSPEKVRHQKHCRTVKILVLDVCVTIIMWSPIIIMMGLIHYDSSKEHDYFLQSHHFIATLIVALANTAFNPVLYGFYNSNIRYCLKHCCKACFTSQEFNPQADDSIEEPSSGGKQHVSSMNAVELNNSNLTIVDPNKTKNVNFPGVRLKSMYNRITQSARNVKRIIFK